MFENEIGTNKIIDQITNNPHHDRENEVIDHPPNLWIK